MRGDACGHQRQRKGHRQVRQQLFDRTGPVEELRQQPLAWADAPGSPECMRFFALLSPKTARPLAQPGWPGAPGHTHTAPPPLLPPACSLPFKVFARMALKMVRRGPACSCASLQRVHALLELQPAIATIASMARIDPTRLCAAVFLLSPLFRHYLSSFFQATTSYLPRPLSPRRWCSPSPPGPSRVRWRSVEGSRPKRCAAAWCRRRHPWL